MTKEEAKAEQERIARHYNLGWWYGTECEKCCGVFPKAMTEGNGMGDKIYYECPVCGKRTPGESMPWIARDDWNEQRFKGAGVQIRMEL